ncbi:tRNA pseudouridine(55) synthase TruB [candidate division KSB3 bacterium]|uniref:tRNA pseudouridine synthase B n=1 Tax=candidate division KSB3 bacterium TaxID=2044937 RepID=A0A2G6EBP2_9BACT|nr:MAG: tRNA pseudouridine(55) synthase TruB [candidate division KSB3 bacterium]
MNDFGGGVFLIDKPEGITSFGIVRRIKKLVGIKKVGHAGTLDPFATGLLVVCAGRPATKMIPLLMDGDKEYLATLRLGIRTTTMDPEGDIIEKKAVGFVSAAEISQCLTGFAGEILQRPPAYSALKHKGKPLYYYARKGIEIEKEPRRVMIHSLERLGDPGDLDDASPELSLRIVCSKGTYIRSLADDIGVHLGCGASLIGLRRIRSGVFHVDQAIAGERLVLPEEREKHLAAMLLPEDVGKMLQSPCF